MYPKNQYVFKIIQLVIILPAKEQSVPCYQEETLSDLLLNQEAQKLLFFPLSSNFELQLQQEIAMKSRVLVIIVT